MRLATRVRQTCLLRGEVNEWEGARMQILDPHGYVRALSVEMTAIVKVFRPETNEVTATHASSHRRASSLHGAYAFGGTGFTLERLAEAFYSPCPQPT